MNPSFLIYGATGYTGTLIAEEAARRGMAPVLGGRDPAKLSRLAARLGLPVRAFACDAPNEIARGLEGVSAVLHCAGPFSATARPMLKACLQTGTHYLDISGEIRVFERILSRPQPCIDKGIVAIPGVGFDVVPTDCIAAALKRKLPDATHLTIAIRIAGPPSPGSFKTLAEGLHAGGLVRRDGKLTPVPAAHLLRRFAFPLGERRTMLAPWADLSSAFYSTGIPNIETYISISPAVTAWMRASRHIKSILAKPSVRRLIKKGAELVIGGPTAAQREKHRYEIWAQVSNSADGSATMRAITPNGYSVTVDASLKAVQRVLSGRVASGAHTPSSAFGPEFLRSLDGVAVS